MQQEGPSSPAVPVGAEEGAGETPCRHREVPEQEWVCWAHMSFGVCLSLGVCFTQR